MPGARRPWKRRKTGNSVMNEYIEITGARDHVRIVAASSGAEQFKRFSENLNGILAVIGELDSQAAAGRE